MSISTSVQGSGWGHGSSLVAADLGRRRHRRVTDARGPATAGGITPNQTLTPADVPIDHGNTVAGTQQTVERIASSFDIALVAGVFHPTLAGRARTHSACSPASSDPRPGRSRLGDASLSVTRA